MQYSVERLPHGYYVVVGQGGRLIPTFFTELETAQALADKLTLASLSAVTTPVAQANQRPPAS
jgi:hypothetical protein